MRTSHTYRTLQQRRAAGDDGFTLIELLIVIVVLGILAAVVVFALGGVTGQSAQSACNSDAKTVETAVAAYNAQVGSNPTAAQLTQSGPTGPVGGPYLRTFPSSTHYSITLPTGGTPAVPTGEVDVTPLPGGTPHNYDTQSSVSPATGCFAVS